MALHLDEMYVKLNGEMVYLWRAVDQEVGRWADNRVENGHLSFRRRERAMLRFRRIKTLQMFVSVHANIHNHFSSHVASGEPLIATPILA